MFRLFCVLIGYAVGCIQTAYYVGKILGKIDIREHGSGNAGSTNMVRTLGLKAGALTFLGDILKALLGFILCTLLFKGSCSFFTVQDGNGLLPGLYASIGIILGHNYPFQLKFKGGKGIACTVAVYLCIDWKIAMVSYIIGIALIIITRYVSLGSIVICLFFAIAFTLRKYQLEETAVCWLLTAMAIYRHKANIGRLLKGNENKFSVKKGDAGK